MAWSLGRLLCIPNRVIFHFISEYGVCSWLVIQLFDPLLGLEDGHQDLQVLPDHLHHTGPEVDSLLWGKKW